MDKTPDTNSDVPVVVFVRSLGHSGSTITGHLLCQSFSAVAMGEIWNFLYRLKEKDNTLHYPCSCGVDSNAQCDFWKSVVDQTGDLSDLKQQYLKTLELAHAQYNLPIVDIGKTEATYKIITELANEGKIRLHTVFLIRDVRGWTTSVSEKSGKKGFVSILKLMRLWYKKNKAILAQYQTQSESSVYISYEEICFLGTEHFIKKTSSKIPLERKTETEIHHVVFGNTKSVRAFDGIQYDTRWFVKNKLNFFYFALKNTRSFNEQNSLFKLSVKYDQARKKARSRKISR